MKPHRKHTHLSAFKVANNIIIIISEVACNLPKTTFHLSISTHTHVQENLIYYIYKLISDDDAKHRMLPYQRRQIRRAISQKASAESRSLEGWCRTSRRPTPSFHTTGASEEQGEAIPVPSTNNLWWCWSIHSDIKFRKIIIDYQNYIINLSKWQM